ncbi:MAG TPA: acyclic terpene utilization AtuA family protein [Candidatus Deferrimicrobiaceae bacterium]
MKTIRIGTGQGYWGDRLDAPFALVDRGRVQYICFDYLAELTMSILQKQKERDPSRGYAHDFVTLCRQILPRVKQQGIRLIASAGGVNPRGCAEAIAQVARGQGLKVKIATVEGDNILDRLDTLPAQGYALKNMDDGSGIEAIRDRVTSANVYLGVAPVVEALNGGADIVITGRNTDTSLFLAPMIHEFGWRMDELDLLACGICIGHVIECGAQVTGGNYTGGWDRVPDLARVGWPIAEVSEDGSAIITKPDGTGGLVEAGTVKEELLYEIGDPRNYITPDVVADFSEVRIEDAGPDRVKLWGAKGRPAPDTLKVSISYRNGFRAFADLGFSWPQALEKAQLAAKVLSERFRIVGLQADAVLFDYIGYNSLHGPLSEVPGHEPQEVRLRVGIRTKTAEEASKLGPEVPCLVTCGPPQGGGYSARATPQEILEYWPALIPAAAIRPEVHFVEVT